MTLMPRLMLLLLALSPLTTLAATPTPLVEGKDYERIADAGPFAPLAGKIEVVEMFGYTCPHCAHFEPQLEAWAAKPLHPGTGCFRGRVGFVCPRLLRRRPAGRGQAQPPRHVRCPA